MINNLRVFINKYIFFHKSKLSAILVDVKIEDWWKSQIYY